MNIRLIPVATARVCNEFINFLFNHLIDKCLHIQAFLNMFLATWHSEHFPEHQTLQTLTNVKLPFWVYNVVLRLVFIILVTHAVLIFLSFPSHLWNGKLSSFYIHSSILVVLDPLCFSFWLAPLRLPVLPLPSLSHFLSGIGKMHWTWTEGENYASAMLFPLSFFFFFFPPPLSLIFNYFSPLLYVLYFSLSLGWKI